jgi:hypothetical protein
MAGRYPTPEEARRRFEEGVELAKEKWVSRAREGATAYETWFTGFANTVYSLVATLPSKEGKTTDTIVDERVKPVVKAIKNLSRSYREAKLKELVKKVAPAVTVRVR